MENITFNQAMIRKGNLTNVQEKLEALEEALEPLWIGHNEVYDKIDKSIDKLNDIVSDEYHYLNRLTLNLLDK